MNRSLAEVAGENAQALRRSAGAKLEDFAAAARYYGLPWSSGRTGDFESGRVNPTLPTLLAVTATLSDILSRPVALQELFAGGGRVTVNRRLSLELASVRDALHDGYEVLARDVTGESERTLKAAEELAERMKTWPKSVRKVPGGDYRDVYVAMRDSDKRMCKTIGVDHSLGAAAMATLWGKTFTARRDELAGPDARAQERGQVSRRLKADLQDILQRKGK
jgi:hypothetical protein